MPRPEPPFASVIGRVLRGWTPTVDEVDEVDEVVGVELDFDGRKVMLKMWQGEVTP
ncbi:hypothetical protein ACQPZJ_43090 [Actinoplanes sp. CA-054009]